jgi:hypothetical protein
MPRQGLLGADARLGYPFVKPYGKLEEISYPALAREFRNVRYVFHKDRSDPLG